MNLIKNDIKMRVNEDLLKRLKAGEEKAFEDLYWIYSPQVYNFINSLLFDKSLAEDLTQNVFLKIWEKHEQIELELGIRLPGIWFLRRQNSVYLNLQRCMLRILI